MATSLTTEKYHNGTGSQVNFDFPFPYTKEADVKVEHPIGTVLTQKTSSAANDYEFLTATTIKFTTAPASGTANVKIYRSTDVDSSKVVFASGSSIRAQDLNSIAEHVLFHTQDKVDNRDITNEAVFNKHVSRNAEIEVSKLKDGSARQLLQTDAAGTGVEWASNIDIPGTLNVTLDAKFDSDVVIQSDSKHLALKNAAGTTKFMVNTSTGETTISGPINPGSTVDGRDVAADGAKLDAIEASATGDQTNAEIRAAVEAASDSNVFTDADHSKLNAIEASATADQTNAEIRAAVEAATDSNVFTDTDHSKLNAIEASATADQTDAEIRAAVEAASDSNVFTDTDHSKLNAIEANADVTDATNVDAAGAVMNSDLDGKGELLVGDGSGDPTALPVGTNNYVLTADSNEATGIKWSAAGSGGDANQNAFSNVAVSGQTTVAADTTTDTLTIVGGTNVTVTTDASADSVTIAASGGEVTVQDEGSSLSTAATTLNFVGSGVVASGTGATKTITISGGGGSVTTDFQYLELKAHNNASGAFSAGSADYELVTKGTTTAVDPGQAAALMISIGGVLQEPNTGTSIGSNDGFCVDGSSIHFGANLTAHPDYILWLKGSGSHTIPDDSIAEVKLDIHADPAGTNKFLGYTSNGMEWAVPPDTDNNTQLTEEQVEDFVGGMVTGNTETGITVTYEDSDGTLDFVVAPEGTSVLSTGESGGTKYLREDGDGTCSWQTVSQYTTPLTTRGDILYRDASGDQRLAKGTDGQYLKIGANDPVWADVVGAVADGCIFENDQTISNNYTIASGKGAHSVGPITVNATVTVNGNWVVS